MVIAGAHVPKGEMVLAVLASANRDRARFDRADVLDVARAENRHVAFGLGLHHCLGAPLARMEARVAIGALVSRPPVSGSASRASGCGGGRASSCADSSLSQSHSEGTMQRNRLRPGESPLSTTSAPAAFLHFGSVTVVATLFRVARE